MSWAESLEVLGIIRQQNKVTLTLQIFASEVSATAYVLEALPQMPQLQRVSLRREAAEENDDDVPPLEMGVLDLLLHCRSLKYLDFAHTTLDPERVILTNILSACPFAS